MKNRLLEVILGVCIYSLIVFIFVGSVSGLKDKLENKLEGINDRYDVMEDMMNE